MNWFTAIASYIVIWWVVLFAILPIGVRSQLEDGDVATGSEPGAPSNPQLGKKALITSAVAGVFWLALVVVVQVWFNPNAPR